MDYALKYHVNKEEIEAEKALVESIKDNPHKFSILYERYYEQLFRFVYQRLDDKDIAFDTTSQVFLKALLNITKYKPKGLPFSSWLFQIARNELNMLYRKNNVQRTLNISSPALAEMYTEMDAEGFGDDIYLLKLALQKLSENDLFILEMRFFEGRPFSEIAGIIEETENNTKVKTYRILKKLKKYLDSVKKVKQ